MPMVNHGQAWKDCKQKMVNVKNKFKDPSEFIFFAVVLLAESYCVSNEQRDACLYFIT